MNRKTLFLSCFVLFVLFSFSLAFPAGASSAMFSRTYGGTDNDTAQSVVQMSDGGYALAGWTYSFGGGGMNIWLVKTESNGNAQWNKTYGGGSAWSMIKTSEGGYALAGTKLVKTDAEGNMQWNQTHSESGQDQIYSLVQTSDGGFALAGVKESSDGGGNDFWLVKTDEAGAVPEFPSWVLMPSFIVATSIGIFLKKAWSHRLAKNRFLPKVLFCPLLERTTTLLTEQAVDYPYTKTGSMEIA